MLSVRERICSIFGSALQLEVPSVEADLFETGILDSLAFVELLLQLEREFDVTTTVEDLEIEHFRSIERIAAYVSARTAPAPAASAGARILPLSARR